MNTERISCLCRRGWILPVILGCLAAGLAYAIARYYVREMPVTTDENSYLFQANNFLDGVIARPLPPNYHIFQHNMIILDHRAGWLSRYPFVHSLLLVPGVWVNQPYLWVALWAVLRVVLISRTAARLGGNQAGLIASVLLICSPFFLFNHATLLSHSSGLLTVALMLWAYVTWKETGRIGYPVVAGLAWGMLVNNRTLTALLLVLPFGVDALLEVCRRKDRETLLGVVAFAMTAAVGFLALLFYNRLAVGEFTTMTYSFYRPGDGPGFGPRHHGRIMHTFGRGWAEMITNIKLLDKWFLGFTGSLWVALVLVVVGWKRRWSGFCLSAVAVGILGYIFFWYPGPRYAGPGYYLELLPFLVVPVSLGVHRLNGRITIWPAVVLLPFILWAGWQRVEAGGVAIQAMNGPRRAMWDFLNSAPPNSLVFVEPHRYREAFAGGTSVIFNPRGLESDPLIAHWHPATHRAMMDYFAERQAFRIRRDPQGQYDWKTVPTSDEKLNIEFSLIRFSRHTGRVATDERARRILEAVEFEHGPGLLCFGNYHFVRPGRYGVAFEVRVRDVGDSDAPLWLEVAGDFGRTIMATVRMNPGHDWVRVPVEFEVDQFMLIESRAWYAGTGQVAIASVTLYELE